VGEASNVHASRQFTMDLADSSSHCLAASIDVAYNLRVKFL